MKKILVAILLLICTNVWSADQWDKTAPLVSSSWVNWPAESQANNNSLDRLLANYREGMSLSYSSATAVSVASGSVTCSNAAGTLRKFRQNATATSVGWADLDTGTEANSTTYYIFANCDADDTDAEFKVSTSTTAPSGITYYKRLGSFYNDASGNISVSAITNDNNYFISPKYDSGWFAASYRSAYTKTHNLGTTDIITAVYYSANADGSGDVIAAMLTDTAIGGSGSYASCGVQIGEITSTTLKLRTGGTCVAFYLNDSGQKYGGDQGLGTVTSGYFRIIASVIK